MLKFSEHLERNTETSYLRDMVRRRQDMGNRGWWCCLLTWDDLKDVAGVQLGSSEKQSRGERRGC